MRQALRRLTPALVAIVVTFGVLELGVRLLGHHDADGQFWFAGVALKPLHPFVEELSTQVAELEEAGRSYLMPDPRLGWTIAPSSTTRDGRYSANSIGVRGTREYAKEKPVGTTRVALFGASYVFGDEVTVEESLGHHLEAILNASGRGRYEVMNFGVGAYGHDQAWLRWRLDAQPYEPDVVVLGYQSGHCKRNVNVIRKFKRRKTMVPYSKPRFVLNDAGGLELLNSPAVAPRDLPALVQDFDRSPLAAHEWFYDPTDYEPSLWRSSKLLAAIEMLAGRLSGRRGEAHFHDPTRPEGQLCQAIVEGFGAEASGEARFVLALQPTRAVLEARQAAGRDDIDPLWVQLRARFPHVDPTDALLARADEQGMDALFEAHGHYVGEANEIVAEVLAEQVLADRAGRN